MADLDRLLEGREFDSPEEVNAFLQQALEEKSRSRVADDGGKTRLIRPGRMESFLSLNAYEHRSALGRAV
jgi:hypothetical protein